MGKGTIISGGESGQYQVQINYSRGGYNSQIVAYTAMKTSLESALVDETDAQKIKLLKLQLLSVDKRIEYLENNFPADETISAWCADLTEDITGTVGTVEVPGEVGNVQIQPGYQGNAAYDPARDGQRMPTVINTPDQAFYNLAMLPGWQKWKPLFRYATITAKTGNTADVTLDPTTSTQQSLTINQSPTLSNVVIEYMDCDGVPFEVGDEVLVKFEGQDWAAPKIVGFKENPKPCAGYLLIKATAPGSSESCIVWDFNIPGPAEDIPTNTGGVATFPILTSEVSDWIAARVSDGSPVVEQTTDGTNEVFYLPTPVPSFPADYTEVTGYPNCNGTTKRCWIIQKEESDSISVGGIDYLGSAGQSAFRTNTILVREEDLGAATSSEVATYDTTVRGDRLTGHVITSLTVGGQRARTAAADMTFTKDAITCYDNTSWPCDTFGAEINVSRAFNETSTLIEYNLISPFSDHTEKSFDHLDIEFVDLKNTCEIYTDYERASGELYKTYSSMAGKSMAVFYVEEIVTINYLYSCAESPFDDTRLRCVGDTWDICPEPEPPAAVTYYNDLNFNVVAFTHTIPDESRDVITDIDPFNIAQDSALSASILGLKNFLGETPAAGLCSGVVFDIDFVK